MMTDVVCSVSMSQILLGNVQKLFGLEIFLHNLLMYSTFLASSVNVPFAIFAPVIKYFGIHLTSAQFLLATFK